MATVRHLGLFSVGCLFDGSFLESRGAGVEVSLAWAMAFVWRVKKFELTEGTFNGTVGTGLPDWEPETFSGDISGTIWEASAIDYEYDPQLMESEIELVCPNPGNTVWGPTLFYSKNAVIDFEGTTGDEDFTYAVGPSYGFGATEEPEKESAMEYNFYRTEDKNKLIFTAAPIICEGSVQDALGFRCFSEQEGVRIVYEDAPSPNFPDNQLEILETNPIIFKINGFDDVELPLYIARSASLDASFEEFPTCPPIEEQQFIQSAATLETQFTIEATEFFTYSGIYDSTTGEQLRPFPS